MSSSTAGKGEICGRFTRDHAEDEQVLNRSRRCAALTKPTVHKPKDHRSTQSLPESFQSIGPLGTTNLVGKAVLSLFPPDQPWAQYITSADVQASADVSDDEKQDIADALFLRGILITTMLESSDLSKETNRRPLGFRSNMRSILEQLIITGDSLSRMTDDFKFNVYGRDCYVTRRDSSGDPLYHITEERLDPLSLSPRQRAKSRLEIDVLKDKSPTERMFHMYTVCEWQPLSRSWLIRQELNGHEINESEEEGPSPYISVPFDLDEHYGRGYVELNLGALRACDNLHERAQHFAALASLNLLFKDQSSLIRDEEMLRPPGSIVSGARMVDGKPVDIGLFKAENLADFKVVDTILSRIEANLGKAFLMESEVTPRGDRVTAFQAARVAMELDGAMGGLYTPIADYLQVPIWRRANWLVEKQKLGPVLPKKAYELELLTGIAALGRTASRAKVMDFVQAMALLGPPGVARINIGVFARVLQRYSNLYEPGLSKTDQQLAAETQAAIAAQTQAAAGQKAVDVAGNVAENALTPSPQGQ